MNRQELKSALESMMFVFGEPLDPRELAKAFLQEKEEVIACFKELMGEYEDQARGIRIRQIAGSYQFVTIPENSQYISKLVTPIREKKLSQAALEVLAIIAYKQPVTKSQIDSIRGIKSDRVLEGLVGKGLAREAGRSEAIGKPILYKTTETFLRFMNISSLKELPEIEDVEDVIMSEDEELISLGQTTLEI